MSDVAQDEWQRAPVTRGALHLAGKMSCEESPAGNPGEVIRRRELAILDERYAQHGFELGNPPGSADARPQLTLRRPAPDAVIRSRNQTRFALMTFVELRNVQNVWRTVCLARAGL